MPSTVMLDARCAWPSASPLLLLLLRVPLLVLCVLDRL
jgi:hypothetical protein